jgi:hypothetical protein
MYFKLFQCPRRIIIGFRHALVLIRFRNFNTVHGKMGCAPDSVLHSFRIGILQIIHPLAPLDLTDGVPLDNKLENLC